MQASLKALHTACTHSVHTELHKVAESLRRRRRTPWESTVAKGNPYGGLSSRWVSIGILRIPWAVPKRESLLIGPPKNNCEFFNHESTPKIRFKQKDPVTNLFFIESRWRQQLFFNSSIISIDIFMTSVINLRHLTNLSWKKRIAAVGWSCL